MYMSILTYTFHMYLYMYIMFSEKIGERRCGVQTPILPNVLYYNIEIFVLELTFRKSFVCFCVHLVHSSREEKKMLMCV